MAQLKTGQNGHFEMDKADKRDKADRTKRTHSFRSVRLSTCPVRVLNVCEDVESFGLSLSAEAEAKSLIERMMRWKQTAHGWH
jgi:hypothetical protein